MRRKPWWQWLVDIVVVLILAGAARRAFSVPWSWTPDQWMLVFAAFMSVALVAWWAILWRREGADAVKQKWAARYEKTPPLSRKAFWLTVGGTVIFLLALSAFFFVIQQQ